MYGLAVFRGVRSSRLLGLVSMEESKTGKLMPSTTTVRQAQRLLNCTATITGFSSGVGRAIVLRYMTGSYSGNSLGVDSTL